MAVNEARLQAFLSRVLHDLAAAQSGVLVAIGDRLGLYRALSDAGPVTPAELAQRAHCDEAYVREWLVNQAAGGYLEYHADSGRFALPEEHALVLAAESSRQFLAGSFRAAVALAAREQDVAAAFRNGGGVDARRYAEDLREGMARTSRARYSGQLVSSWLPALEGVSARLEAGGSAADVGCGDGVAVCLLAEAFPRARVAGFDVHAPALERGRRAAHAAGLDERVSFVACGADSFPGSGYALVLCLDTLHELADPLAAARRVRDALAPDGAWLIVEPPASDAVEQNLGTLGRFFSALSVLYCLPTARAAGGAGLGAMAGEAPLREVVRLAGFARFRKVAENAFGRVFEARP